MKYLILLIATFAVLLSFTKNSNEWEILFDGKNVDKLRGYKMDSFPYDAWEVINGAISTKTDVQNVDIVTKKLYKDFELNFEWRISKAGNSGVFHHVQEIAVQEAGNGNSPNWLNDFEMQILDDIDFHDNVPIRSAGSLYDLIAPTNKKLKPVGEYNTAKLIVKGNHVEHWLNGTKVLEYENDSDELNNLLSKSKFKDNPDYGKAEPGHIMFQHHGQKVWFKNMKIRKL